MGITPNDIAAQRAMIERGEEKRKAEWKLAERERLRDTFAAAALKGLLAGPGDKDFSMDYWARHAYGAADAMLRERDRVTEPMPKEKRAEVSSAPVFADKTRSWPVSYEKSDEKRVLYDTNHDAVPEAIGGGSTLGNPVPPATVTGNTAESLCGSLPRYLGDGVSPSHNDKNLRHTQRPVAWARFFPNGGPQSVYLDRPPPDAEPLYCSPTLTDEEREAIEWCIFQQATPQRTAVTLRRLLERMR